MEIESKVKNIIKSQLGLDDKAINLDSKFIDDLGADSLDTVEMIMAFEEEFGVEIPEEDAEKILTVKSAVDYIQQKSAE